MIRLLGSRTLLAFLVAAVAGLLDLAGLFLLPRCWPDVASLPAACATYQAVSLAYLGALGVIAGVLGGRHLRLTGPTPPTTAQLLSPPADG